MSNHYISDDDQCIINHDEKKKNFGNPLNRQVPLATAYYKDYACINVDIMKCVEICMDIF